jgi:hypothetical protein
MYVEIKISDTDTSMLFWVINLVILVVFLRMAYNVNLIRKSIAMPSGSNISREIAKLKFMGKKEKVLELHYHILWDLFNQPSEFPEFKTKGMLRVVAEIEELEGSVPEEVKDFLNKYLK